MLVPGSYTDGYGRPARVVWWMFLLTIVAGFLLVLRILVPFLGVILLALVTTALVYPVFERFVKFLGGRRRLAAVIVCVVLVIAVLAPLVVLTQAVSVEAFAFYQMSTTELTRSYLAERIQGEGMLLDRINHYLAPFSVELKTNDVVERVTRIAVELGGFFYRQGVLLAKGILRLVLGFLFWVLVLYYLLLDGPALEGWFLDVLPLPANQQQLLFERFTDMAGSLIIGNGVAGLLQGTFGGLWFALLGIPGPVLWGVVMAVLAFIPIIGISLVFVPVGLVLALSGDVVRALLVVIPLVIVSGLVEYLLKPALVGRRMQMHTLLVFLSLLGGLAAFGPLGLLIGPFVTTAFLTLILIYREQYRHWLLPSEVTVPVVTTQARAATTVQPEESTGTQQRNEHKD